MEQYEYEQAEQQPQVVGNYPIGYLPPEQNEANLVLQTDPSSEVSLIEHKLRAEYWDINKKEWVKAQGVKPYMNEEGIFTIMTRLSSILTNNTRFTNLNDLEINRLVLDFADEITILISLNWKKYEMSKSHFRTIVNMLSQLAFLVLKRAMNDGERKFVGRTTHSQESRIEHIMPRPQRGKTIARIFGR